MTADDYNNLPVDKRLFIDLLVDIKRDLRRIADALERLVEQDSR